MITLLTRVRRARAGDGESGMALLMVIMFLGVATTLIVTATTLTIDALSSSHRDSQALGALATAEGGVAQAVQVIRTNPPAYFTCDEPAAGAAPAGACVTNPQGWTSASAPEKVSSNGTIGACVPSLACYSVWIATLIPYNNLPYANSAGTPARTVEYRIHSTGIAGNGPAARSVLVDVQATLASFPIGVYGDTIQTSGSPGIHHESVFSLGCITNRSQDGQNGNGLSFDAFSSVDPYADYDWGYDLPEAAHSAAVISTSSNCAASSNRAAIHNIGACANSTQPGGNYDYFPFDQDSMGGSLSGTSCYQQWTSPVSGKQYATTSLFTTQDLYNVGYRPQGLTPQEYDSLKQQADGAGTYFSGNVSRTQIASALASVTTSTAVLYIDANGSSISFGPGDIPPQFFRSALPPGTASCPLNSLIVIVRNGNLTYDATGQSGGSDLVASIFVPEGTYSGRGSAQILGTLFAKTTSLGGTQDFYMDQCFASSPPAMLLNLNQVRYHEVDTQNIQ